MLYTYLLYSNFNITIASVEIIFLTYIIINIVILIALNYPFSIMKLYCSKCVKFIVIISKSISISIIPTYSSFNYIVICSNFVLILTSLIYLSFNHIVICSNFALIIASVEIIFIIYIIIDLVFLVAPNYHFSIIELFFSKCIKFLVMISKSITCILSIRIIPTYSSFSHIVICSNFVLILTSLFYLSFNFIVISSNFAIILTSLINLFLLRYYLVKYTIPAIQLVNTNFNYQFLVSPIIFHNLIPSYYYINMTCKYLAITLANENLTKQLFTPKTVCASSVGNVVSAVPIKHTSKVIIIHVFLVTNIAINHKCSSTKPIDNLFISIVIYAALINTNVYHSSILMLSYTISNGFFVHTIHDYSISIAVVNKAKLVILLVFSLYMKLVFTYQLVICILSDIKLGCKCLLEHKYKSLVKINYQNSNCNYQKKNKRLYVYNSIKNIIQNYHGYTLINLKHNFCYEFKLKLNIITIEYGE